MSTRRDEVAEIAELIRTKSPALSQPPEWALWDAIHELDLSGGLHPAEAIKTLDPRDAARAHLLAWEFAAQNQEYQASQKAKRAALKELSMEEFNSIRDIARQTATAFAKWGWVQYDEEDAIGVGLATNRRNHATKAYHALREKGYDAVLVGGISVRDDDFRESSSHGVVLQGLTVPAEVRDNPKFRN